MADLKQLLERLSDADIEFVIVGGFAAVLHGSTIVTRDLDVCTVLAEATVDKLRKIHADLSPVHRIGGGRLSFAGAIDLLTSITGVGDYGRVRAEASAIELFGRCYFVMSLNDLITAKRAPGREKDLLAARELEAISERLK